MDGSVIKSPEQSPNPLDEILEQENPKVKTITDLEPELSNTSSVSVDHRGQTVHNIEDPSVSDEQEQSEHQIKEEIVEGLEDPDNISSIIITTENEMTKPTKSRVSCKETTKSISDDKKTGKIMPVKNTTRKVLVEKQIRSIPPCDEPGIFLRSKRKKSADFLGQNSPNSNMTTSRENQGNITSPSLDKANCNPVEENDPKQSVENSDPLSLANVKQNTAKTRTKRTIPYEGLSLMEKIIIREHEMIESMCNRVQSTHPTNDDGVSNNVEKSSADGSGDAIQNDGAPKKRFHRRKCSEPFKNERVQTRQSRSITLMQNKNEYKYFSQDPKTTKCRSFEPDEESVEKTPVGLCAIICTPDISANDQGKEISSDENQNPVIGSVDEENKRELGCEEDQHALNTVKKSPADKILLGSKNDSKSPPIDSRISMEEIGSSKTIAKPFQLSKKRVQENEDENPKRKLRHVNAETMPVYSSKIAVTKNYYRSQSVVEKSLLLSQTGNNGDKSSDMDHDKAKKKTEKEPRHFSSNMTLRSKTDKTTDAKFSYISNTDSEDTLSNVESVPNSPAQETWSKLPGKNLKLGNKRVRLNSGQSSSSRKEPSSVVERIPMDSALSITEKDCNVESRSGRKRKCSQTEISSTSNCSNNRSKSELRYYIETSSTPNPPCVSDSSDKHTENGIGDDDLGERQETPWLRHYERPHKTDANIAKNSTELEDNGKEKSSRQHHNLFHQQKRDVESTKKTSCTSVADDSPSFMLGNRTERLRQPVNNPPVKKRGRPRKQDARKSELNSRGTKRKEPPTSRMPLNGSGLTKLELERLFFKFLQDGHFRVVPGQPPIIIHNNDFYQQYSARMQCYDPRKYYPHPYNAETKSNADSKTYPYSQQHFPAYNDGNRFYPPNTTSSGELGHGSRTMNPNSHNFSNEYVGQTTFTRNRTPCSSHTNIHSYSHSDNPVMNTSGFNASNYMQSGYSTASNYYQQNFHNNNAHVMGNNSYSDGFSGSNSLNSNSSMSNTNSGTTAANVLSTNNNFEDDFNFILNTENQHSISSPCTEMDLTMSNGNTVSSNSTSFMQNSHTNNVNLDWNLSGTNQHLNSANGLLMDLNSINNVNQSSQAINECPDLKNVMNNANSMINVPNPWMNRSDNMMNPRFPVRPPWHPSLPMYNSYLNNGNAYYNNMFNPYTAFMGFDLSNGCMDSKSGIGMTNDTWMQNMNPGSDGHSTFNSTNTDFSNMNSGSLQENILNQGMNLSLSSEASTFPQTNPIKEDGTDLDLGHGNGLNSDIDQLKGNTFEQVKVDNDKDLQESYSEETCLQYSSGYRNDMESLDFNNIKVSNINTNDVDNQQQRNLPQIQDYMNQRSDCLESRVNQSYGRSGTPSCEIITDLPQNRQTEMSKLRQELVDFTRQYSEDQSEDLPEGDEIFI